MKFYMQLTVAFKGERMKIVCKTMSLSFSFETFLFVIDFIEV